MTDPLTVEWDAAQVRVMEQLHDWTVDQRELDQHLAAWMGLPTSDAGALGHVVWAAEAGEPLSPAELSRRIAMTSGATTVLLHRLESAGHVVRSRESADRRRVTLRPTPAARDEARRFLAFAGGEVAEALSRSTASELAVVSAFLERMTAATTEANARLRSGGRQVRVDPSGSGAAGSS